VYRRRRCTVIGAVALLAITALPAPIRGGEPDLRFPDGGYTGTFVYTGQIDHPAGVFAFGGVNGPLLVVVNGGSVVDGTFNLTGSAASVVPGGGANAVVDVSGIIDGTAVRPVMRAQSASFEGTANAQGFEVPFSISFGAGDMIPAPMEIESATCTQVVGDFTQQLEAAIAAQGFATDLYGRFVAVRKGSVEPGAEAVLADLVHAASELVNAAATGSADAASLIEVVERAEDFSAGLKKNAECGFINNAGEFNTALTGLIRDLLEVVITDPDAFGTGDLVELLTIGLRVGAVGAGATDQATSDKIIGNFKNIFDDRIDAAVAVGDEVELQLLLLAAITFGWEDLVKKATK
jgi:hypothetical protein